MKLHLHFLSTIFLSVVCILLGRGSCTNIAHGRNLEKNVTLTDDLSLTDQVTYETDVHGEEESGLELDHYNNEEVERLSEEVPSAVDNSEEDAEANDLEKLKLLQEVADLKIQNSVLRERAKINELEKLNFLQDFADLRNRHSVVEEVAKANDLEKTNLLQEVSDLKIQNSVHRERAEANELEKLNFLQDFSDLKHRIKESEKVQERFKEVEIENTNLVREVATLKQLGELQTQVAKEQAASHLKEVNDLNTLVINSEQAASATQLERMSLVETIDRNNVIIAELQSKVTKQSRVTDDTNWWIAACALLSILAILSKWFPYSLMASSKIEKDSISEDLDQTKTAVTSKSAKQLGGGSKKKKANKVDQVSTKITIIEDVMEMEEPTKVTKSQSARVEKAKSVTGSRMTDPVTLNVEAEQKARLEKNKILLDELERAKSSLESQIKASVEQAKKDKAIADQVTKAKAAADSRVVELETQVKKDKAIADQATKAKAAADVGVVELESQVKKDKAIADQK